MTKAVIFDCYGVLVGDGLPGFVARYVKDPAQISAIWERDDLINKGQMSVDSIFELLAHTTGKPVDRVAKELDVNHANEQLFEYVQHRLQNDYKLAVCSNMAKPELLQKMIGERITLFDSIVLSCDLGTVKPDVRMYETVVSKLGLPANQCIYIDDKERYCTPAEKLGMITIHFRSFDQFKTELEAILQV